jgi:hypothetical protein
VGIDRNGLIEFASRGRGALLRSPAKEEDMPSLREERERIKYLLREGKINDDTRVKIIIPSIDVHERIRNEKKIRRIVIQTDEDGVSDYAALKEATMRELDENPSLYFTWFMEALRNYNPRTWKEEMEAVEHVMGRDLHESE